MQTKSFLMTAGVSMALGAAAVLMLPVSSPVRKAAGRAARAMEDAWDQAADRMLH